MTTIKILLVLLVSGLISCNNITRMKFDKSGWNSKNDIVYDYRENMLNDLIENHKVTGLKYSDLIDLLGPPDSKDSVSISYQISIDYGTIDPVAGKDFILRYNKDSIIESFKVNEWNN